MTKKPKRRFWAPVKGMIAHSRKTYNNGLSGLEGVAVEYVLERSTGSKQADTQQGFSRRESADAGLVDVSTEGDQEKRVPSTRQGFPES